LVARALGYEPPQTPPDYGIRAPEPGTVIVPERYVVCLHGTSRASKEWPEDHWRELSVRLAAKGFATLFPWGDEDEKARAGRLCAPGSQGVVLPRLGLRELAALFGRAQAVVGVDSGLTHLACALDRPTVAIYTDTSPVLTGVYPRDPSRAVNLGEAASAPSLARGPRLNPIGDTGTIPSVDAVWQALTRWIKTP